MSTPLLLLHGALGSAAQFDTLRAIWPQDRPVHALNLPGHGGLPADEPFAMTRFAEAILDFLNQKNWPVADIFGYSMGGYAALQLALEHPERIGRIATLGTKFDWTPETADRETALLDPDKIAAKVPQFAATLAERHAPADWKTVLKRTAGLLSDLGNGAALQPEDFARIGVPVTILRGELDHMVTEEESRRTAGLLPNGQFATLAGTKHAFEQVHAPTLAERLRPIFG